jgi:hypothetical protein
MFYLNLKKIEIIHSKLSNYTVPNMSSYVPPHKRNAVASSSFSTNTKPIAKDKKEHRDLFPMLRNEAGETMMPIAPTQPVISWSGIYFHVDDVMTAAPVETLKDGWIKLSTYVPSTETTTAQLLRCAAAMEANHRRYYWEKGMEIPRWIVDNPYEHFQDFERTIPYEDDYISESDSSSEGEDVDPLYESDTSN